MPRSRRPRNEACSLLPTTVMAGLVPAIYALFAANQYVDARDKPGHDERKLAAKLMRHHHQPSRLRMNTQFLIQLLVNGLVVGTLYGVVAMSFVLIYKATQ